jgi:Vacuolar protein sorting-associated protein 62
MAPIQSVEIPISKGILTVTLDQVAQFAPVVLFHEQDPYAPCAIEYLLGYSTLHADGTVIPNATQATLASNPGTANDPAYYLDLTGGPTAGSPQPPIYVSVQAPADESYVDLNFYFLFAFNGSQCAHVDPPAYPPAFDCMIPTFANHQGDIEGMSVRVSSDLKTVIWVRYEAHGNSTFYPPQEVTFWRDASGSMTTNPIVYSGLNSHATYPGASAEQSGNYVVTETKLGFLSFADYIRPNKAPWIPFERTNGQSVPNGTLVFVGLLNGQPVGDQIWAAYAGYIGKTLQNTFTLPPGLQPIGTPDPNNWPQQAVYGGALATGYAKVFSYITPERFVGEGPKGLGAKASINMTEPCWASWYGGAVQTPFSGVCGSSQGPALVTVGDVLVMVYPSSSLQWAIYQNSQWTDRQATGLTAAGNMTPALADFNEQLVLVYVDSKNALHWATLDYATNEDPASWSWTDMGTILNLTTTSGPALCELGATLYMVYPGADDKLSWATYDGTAWTDCGQIAGGAMTSQSAPALAVVADSACMVYRGHQSNNIYVAWYSAGQWVNPAPKNQIPSQSTDAGPSLAEIDGDLICVYLANSSQAIYYTFQLGTFDVGNWSGSQRTYAAPTKNDFARGTPAIAAAPDVDGVYLYMAYLDNDGSGAIWLNTCIGAEV